jgi:hypothetical protein
MVQGRKKTTNDKRIGKEELIKHLEVVAQRVRHHHDALWEEEKHYSWWVYIIFAGLIFLYINDNIATAITINIADFGSWIINPKLALICVLSSLGMYLSIAAFRVVYIEGRYFDTAREIYENTVTALDLDKPIHLPNGSTISLIKVDFKPKITIRRFFRVNFLITTILFASFIVFSAMTLA